MRAAAFSVVLGTTLAAMATAALAAGPSESDRIEAALRAIEQSQVTFIRNGTEHDGKAAGKHLRSKVQRAGKRQKTFEQFVDQLATRSSLSGRAYLVKLKDGSVEPAAGWLRKQDAARHPPASVTGHSSETNGL